MTNVTQADRDAAIDLDELHIIQVWNIDRVARAFAEHRQAASTALEAAGNEFALYASHLLNCRYGTVMQHTILGGETVAYEALPCTCGYSAALEAWHNLTEKAD